MTLLNDISQQLLAIFESDDSSVKYYTIVVTFLFLIIIKKLTSSTTKKVAKLKTLILPNDKEVFSFQEGETKFLYDEIWKDNTYVSHGLELKENDTVFDIGSNIGMFSMYCGSITNNNINLFSFEPIPRIHEICKANIDKHVNDNGGNANCLQLGISDKISKTTFDFHHNFSLWSTALPDFNERRKDRLFDDLSAMTQSYKKTGRCKCFFSLVPNFIVSCLAKLFLSLLNQSEKVECNLTTISTIIKKYNVQVIDLLKIDIEGCEELALNGIEKSDWKKIRQITLEVENFAAVKRITKKLIALGYIVSSQASERIANPDVSSQNMLCNVTRPKAVAFDLDGTLVTLSNIITPRTLKAIKQFAATGGTVVIATGRPAFRTTDVADKFLDGICEYCVCEDGAYVVKKINNAWIPINSRSVLPEYIFPYLKKVKQVFPDAEIGVKTRSTDINSLCVSSMNYIDVMETRTDQGDFARRAARMPIPNNFDEFLTSIRPIDEIQFARIIHPSASAKELLTVLEPMHLELEGHQEKESNYNLVVQESTVLGVLISSPEQDKSFGLSHICSELNLTSDDFCVFGDGGNDLGMFAWAKQGVCPSNGQIGLKNTASYISKKSHHEDFIAEVLESWDITTSKL